MNLINIYADVPEFLPALLAFIIPIFFIVLMLCLVAFFIKHRSTISGITFFLLLSAGCCFLIALNNGEVMEQILEIGVEYGIGPSLVNCIVCMASPVLMIHAAFLGLIGSFIELNVDILNIIDSGLFLIAVYGIIFLLGFIFFKRKKRQKRIYSDYES